jgi:hypothetical protein
MCFYNKDYDWVATVNETEVTTADNPTRCDECRTPIAVGEWIKTIHQQEYEACQICEDEFADDYDEEQDKATCEHKYGETFDYVRCEACDKVLRAIEVIEIEEDCPADARQPALTMLLDELFHFEPVDRMKYIDRAVEMFPEIRGCELVSLVVAEGQ